MLNVRFFIAVFLASMILLQFVNSVAPMDTDPFTDDDPARLNVLFNQPLYHIAAFKIRHAQRQPAYDLGVFGNSRIMPANQDARASAGRVFNFFIPGASLRTSVALLEWLDDIGQLPKAAVIMVDNFVINTQQVQILPIGRRLTLSIKDIQTGLDRPSISLKDIARMTVRHVDEERIQFLENLKFTRLRKTLALATADTDGWFETPQKVIRRDGSGLRNRAETPHSPEVPPAVGSSLISGYLTGDLERLAQLKDRVRIVLYESPLEPNAARYYADKTPAFAKAHRILFFEACARLALDCHQAPILGEVGQPNSWSDASHPPAELLNPYILSLLQGGS